MKFLFLFLLLIFFVISYFHYHFPKSYSANFLLSRLKIIEYQKSIDGEFLITLTTDVLNEIKILNSELISFKTNGDIRFERYYTNSNHRTFVIDFKKNKNNYYSYFTCQIEVNENSCKGSINFLDTEYHDAFLPQSILLGFNINAHDYLSNSIDSHFFILSHVDSISRKIISEIVEFNKNGERVFSFNVNNDYIYEKNEFDPRERDPFHINSITRDEKNDLYISVNQKDEI